MGFTLEEIAFILENEDLPTLIPVFERQIKKLDDELARLAVAKDAVLMHLEQHALKNQPAPPTRYAWSGCPKSPTCVSMCSSMPFPLSITTTRNDALAWYYVLRLVKHDMVARNIPLELFGNVCDLISVPDLLARNLAVSSAWHLRR